MTLADQPLGCDAVIACIHDDSPIGDRLMEMGLTPGTSVRVLRKSAGGELLQLLVRGYRLSIRRSDAATIELNP